MHLRPHIYTFIFLTCSIFLYGQEYDFVRGTVTDINTGEPVVFATIRVKDKALGVITNMDGSFRFPKRFKDTGDTLLISCMGYRTKTILFTDLSLSETNQIDLEPALFELNEAVVKGKRKKEPSARQIVKKAISRIPDNYPSEPFATVGYYRDYQLKQNEYINLNEAVVNIFDQGFQSNDFESTKVQIYDYVKNTGFLRDSFAARPYDYSNRSKIIENAYLSDFGGNELNILRMHDAIRNHTIKTFSYVNRLRKDFIRNHSFSRKPDISFGEDRMFVLHFDKSWADLFLKNTRQVFFVAKGEMYISRSTYAIHKFTYELYDNREAGRNTKNGSLQNGKLLFEVTVEYRDEDGKMFPNYISFHNFFRIQKAQFRVEDIDFDLESKRFEVRFNKVPTNISVRNKQNYRIEYKNKKLQIREIQPMGTSVFLYPNSKAFESISEDFLASYNRAGELSFQDFHCSFRDIEDHSGNKVNDFKYEDLNQFREYFVQEVNKSSPMPPDDLLMFKDRPIFKEQPISKPDNFDEYWMNTPLKKAN